MIKAPIVIPENIFVAPDSADPPFTSGYYFRVGDPRHLCFCFEGKETIRVALDNGEVELAPGLAPSEAANQFWWWVQAQCPDLVPRDEGF